MNEIPKRNNFHFKETVNIKYCQLEMPYVKANYFSCKVVSLIELLKKEEKLLFYAVLNSALYYRNREGNAWFFQSVMET